MGKNVPPEAHYDNKKGNGSYKERFDSQTFSTVRALMKMDDAKDGPFNHSMFISMPPGGNGQSIWWRSYRWDT